MVTGADGTVRLRDLVSGGPRLSLEGAMTHWPARREGEVALGPPCRRPASLTAAVRMVLPPGAVQHLGMRFSSSHPQELLFSVAPRLLRDEEAVVQVAVEQRA